MRWFLLLTATTALARAESVTEYPTSIINGDPANIEDYPFYVYLRKDDEKLHCGGSLIQANIILTAAHCLRNVELTVYLGITTEDDLQDAEPYEIDEVVIHPLYNKHAQKRHDDIALIRLVKDVVYGIKVRPIELADFKPPVDEQVTVIGFGKVACDDFRNLTLPWCQNPASTHLRKAIMSVTATDEDAIEAVSVVSEQVACYGDSGGPMIYGGKLVGISNTVGTTYCTAGNKYLPVDEYLPWIQEYIDASNNGCTCENTNGDAATENTSDDSSMENTYASENLYNGTAVNTYNTTAL